MSDNSSERRILTYKERNLFYLCKVTTSKHGTPNGRAIGE